MPCHSSGFKAGTKKALRKIEEHYSIPDRPDFAHNMILLSLGGDGYREQELSPLLVLRPYCGVSTIPWMFKILRSFTVSSIAKFLPGC
jgi:hypothetical protein